MVNTKVNCYTEETCPACCDYLYLGKSGGCSGFDRHVTVTNLLSGATSCGWDNVVVLAADQTLTCNTCFTTITGFTFCACASSTYALHVNIQFSANATPDIKFDHVIPSGATLIGTDSVWRGWATSLGVSENLACPPLVLSTSGAENVLAYNGRLVTSVCSGVIAAQFAQNNSSACVTTVHAGSFFAWKKSS